MSQASPSWTPLIPTAPPTIPASPGTGRVVAVLATRRAEAQGWAPEAAVALARAWRAQGRRVVLMDLGVEDPSLHIPLALPNAEGVTDAVLYGASPRRIAVPAGDDGLFFVSAGTAAADAESIASSPRWAKLVEAFLQARATVVLYAPADATGLWKEADDVVVLGAPGEDVSAWTAEGARLRGLLCTPPSPGDEHTEEPEDPLDPLGVDPLATLGSRIPATLPPQRPADGPAPGEPARSHRSMWSGRSRWVVGTGAVLVSVAVVATQGLWRNDGAPDGAGAVTSPATVQPPQAEEAPRPEPESAPPPELVSPLRGFSVALASFRDQASADARRRVLEGRIPRGFLHPVPVEVGGVPYYRLLLGPAPDSAGAEALAAEVADALGADPAAWIIRATPLAFNLGDFATLEAAGADVQRWQEAGIPVYVLELAYSDGARAFRVYAGAYENEAEARYMAGLLSAAGAPEAALVPRMGTLPAG